ncbi:hypothetical protein EJ02DRAFT_510510 [Clathrospora elynae]|uniref:Uncharacterized protein n=1 Tax=Clathrospora elynae TaxID=706981 RepID=A0A6A5SXR8_9PLEO|nr:hypothetical protein EJ02DRAFT_510510 [Clathrospora elynae]
MAIQRPCDTNTPAITTQHVYSDPDGKIIWEIGPAAFPPKTPAHMRRSSNKSNHCDSSVHLLLRFLMDILVRFGATVE